MDVFPKLIHRQFTCRFLFKIHYLYKVQSVTWPSLSRCTVPTYIKLTILYQWCRFSCKHKSLDWVKEQMLCILPVKPVLFIIIYFSMRFCFAPRQIACDILCEIHNFKCCEILVRKLEELVVTTIQCLLVQYFFFWWCFARFLFWLFVIWPLFYPVVK